MRTEPSTLFSRISPRHTPPPPPKSASRDGPTSLPLKIPSQPPPAPPPKPEPELELSTSPLSVEQTLAARRAKRQAILAKYAGISSAALSQGVSPSPGPSSAVEPPPTSPALSNTASQSYSPHTTPAANRSVSVSVIISESLAHQSIFLMNTVGKRESVSVSPTPGAFSLAKDQGADGQVKGQVQDGTHEQISAADYDPSLDRREDEKRVLGVKDEPMEDTQVVEEVVDEEDDVEDMFAIATTEKKSRKVKKVVVSITKA